MEPPCITLTTSNTQVKVGFRGDGPVTIDWGDGKPALTVTLDSAGTQPQSFTRYNMPSGVKTIRVEGEGITTFNCGGENLTSLVVNNPALKSLSCSDNKLTSLVVSNSPALTMLQCNKNSLSKEKLEALADSLPQRDPDDATLFICNDNPGYTEAEAAIKTSAKAKNWTVFSF